MGSARVSLAQCFYDHLCTGAILHGLDTTNKTAFFDDEFVVNWLGNRLRHKVLSLSQAAKREGVTPKFLVVAAQAGDMAINERPTEKSCGIS